MTFHIEETKNYEVILQLERQGFLEWPKSQSPPVQTPWMGQLYEEYDELELLTKDDWEDLSDEDIVMFYSLIGRLTTGAEDANHAIPNEDLELGGEDANHGIPKEDQELGGEGLAGDEEV
ncbi:39S ribosomal protein L50, mitochondrial [Corchorus capsularis]|uniref:39S ribosomal protein L50, mitochondrial n=1 Tax=Corchorus capsularis TaxID=210143 RepID=A0A1R3HJZ2_COCAP|nr:39S ribosomal protein L50, mitochondrial [Corchorus capsularis]